MFSFFVIFLWPTSGPGHLFPLRFLSFNRWRTWTLMRWVILMMSMWSLFVAPFIVSTVPHASLPRVVSSPPLTSGRGRVSMSLLVLSLFRWWGGGWVSPAVLFLSVNRRWWRWGGVPPATTSVLLLSPVTFIWGASVPPGTVISSFSLLSTTIVGIINITNARTLCCYLWFKRCSLRHSWSRLGRYITEFAATWKSLSWLKLFNLLKYFFGLFDLLFFPAFFIKLIFDQIFGYT